MSSQPSRFFNFPLVLNMKVVSDQRTALDEIVSFALCEYAENIHSDHNEALIQACYLSTRQRNTHLPGAVKSILQRGDVRCYSEYLNECWGTDNFRHEASKLLEERKIELSAGESKTLTGWHTLYNAAKCLNIQIGNFEGVERGAESARRVADEHERRFGALTWCSIDTEYLFETMKSCTVDDGRIFCMVCAVRSLIGAKIFTGTVKDMIRARMVGAKIPHIASILASEDPAIAEEMETLESRKRFDRLMKNCCERGFFCKVAAGRRVYLSTKIKDPVELARKVQESYLRKSELKERQKKGRCIMMKKNVAPANFYTTRDSIGDIIGDIIGDSFKKSFQ